MSTTMADDVKLREQEIELVVVGRRCVYLNDHRIAGAKPYVSENLPQHSFKLRVKDVLAALPEVARALANTEHSDGR